MENDLVGGEKDCTSGLAISMTAISGVCGGLLLQLAADTTGLGGRKLRHMAVACSGEVECADAN